MDTDFDAKLKVLEAQTKSGRTFDEPKHDDTKLKDIRISILEDHPYESYIYGDNQDISQIIKSIERNGYFGNPIAVSHRDDRYIIISGHSRVKAYKQLGYKTIPCQIYEDLTEEQEINLLTIVIAG